MMKRKSESGDRNSAVIQQTAKSIQNSLRAEIFLTFSGNCKSALIHYRECFGGTVSFQTFGRKLKGFATSPVVCGTLLSDTVVIHGSDLVPDEGRTIGNYIGLFLKCRTNAQRKSIIAKLTDGKNIPAREIQPASLVEISDVFGTRWILGL